MNKSKICLALDGLSRSTALALVASLGAMCYAVKIHDLLDARGPSVIDDLKTAGAKRVWVDYKLHDTKDTVAHRVGQLVNNGADIITLHASGGMEMMKMAMGAALAGPAEIFAITVLTSLSPEEVSRIYGFNKDGTARTPAQVALYLALMAKEAGANGIVCSALEVGLLSTYPDLKGMKFVVPGTRSAGVDLGQQKRSTTPAEAIGMGATHLVAGTQVTKATDPLAAFRAMAAEIGMEL
jgi:orotidine-5'-phosphate decarboxylase